MSERPLYVKVAEALGWTHGVPEGIAIHAARMAMFWTMWPPATLEHLAGQPRQLQLVPRYDTDWSATGPLVERYGWILRPIMSNGAVRGWEAVSPWYCAEGPKPLRAVCNLVLALHAAGKLPEG